MVIGLRIEKTKFEVFGVSNSSLVWLNASYLDQTINHEVIQAPTDLFSSDKSR